MRILVVEDDYFSREMMIQLFLQDGFDAVGVESGEEALSQIDAAPFDLVLTDINLPGINGFQLCQELRTGRNLSPTMMPVIGVTVDPDEEQMQTAQEKGMLTLLRRPVKPADVISVLESGNEEDAMTTAEVSPTRFDPTAINQLAEVIGNDKVSNLINMYFKDLKQGLLDLLESLEGADNDASAKLAHRLAGSCANYGFLTSHKTLKQVQHLCESGQPGECSGPVREIVENLESDKARVSELLG